MTDGKVNTQYEHVGMVYFFLHWLEGSVEKETLLSFHNVGNLEKVLELFEIISIFRLCHSRGYVFFPL